jgi:DNA-binding GntR family transcriptional regulator
MSVGCSGHRSRNRAPSAAEAVRLRLLTDDERQFLRLDIEQRVYAIRRTARDNGGRVVEVNNITLPAHQWELVYMWEATD